MHINQDPTSLEACVLHVCAILGQPLSLNALQEERVVQGSGDDTQDQATRDIRAAIEVCQRAGLKIGFGRITLAKVSSSVLPAILPLHSGQAVILKSHDGSIAQIQSPTGDGSNDLSTRTIDLSELQGLITGHALTLQSAHPDTSLTTHSMPEGAEQHWFWSALRANHWAYMQVLLAAVVANTLTLGTSLFTMVVYDRILPSSATDSLIALTCGMAVALVFLFIISSLRSSFIDQAAQRADAAMSDRLFAQVLDMEMAARKGSAGATASTLREYETLRDFFTSATLVALVDLPFSLLFIVVIMMFAPLLGLVPLIALPLVILIGVAIQPRLARLSDQLLGAGKHKQAILVETLTGIETIKATGARRQMARRWHEAQLMQSDYALKSRSLTQFAVNATAFIQQTAQVMLVFIGALLVVEGQITSGILIAAVILTGRALAPLALIAQTLSRVHQARASYRALDEIMSLPAQTSARQTHLARPHLKGAVRLDNVSFSYPGQTAPALDAINLSIAPGEKIAIVGPVGSGKSTLLRLILGLYQPSDGVVLLDGINIAQIDPTDLRHNIGSVLQESWLVSGTLRENIAFGARLPSDAQILHAAQLAGVEDFAATHSQGYDMRLREGGIGLSGGQRQMVTMSRALFGDPSILVFDEPSSAMDIPSEMALVSRLRKHCSMQTIVVSTHRPGMLELVDRVIVMDKGKIVSDTPHRPKNDGSLKGAA